MPQTSIAAPPRPKTTETYQNPFRLVNTGDRPHGNAHLKQRDAAGEERMVSQMGVRRPLVLVGLFHDVLLLFVILLQLVAILRVDGSCPRPVSKSTLLAS